MLRLLIALTASLLLAAPARAQGNALTIPSAPTRAPFAADSDRPLSEAVHPLSEALDPDGRLALRTGCFDAEGYALTLGADGAPRFSRVIEPAAAGAAAAGAAGWRAGFFVGPGVPAGGLSVVALDGDDVYVGGIFDNLGGVPGADNLARYNRVEDRWYAVGDWYAGDVRQIVVTDTEVYVGGRLLWIVDGEVEQQFVLRFDKAAETWSTLGTGPQRAMPIFPVSEGVDLLRLIGDDLWVGGYFVNAGDLPDADVLAVWNTTTETWRDLGPFFEIDPNDGFATVHAAVPVNGGVYVSCFCAVEGGIGRNLFWTGSAWEAIEGFSSTGSGVTPFALDLFEDELYFVRTQAGFSDGFEGIPGVPDGTQFMRWDGETFTPLAGTFPDRSQPTSLARYDGAWIVGLGSLDGRPDHPFLMRNTGGAWEQYGPPLDRSVSTLVPDGEQLWLGGFFEAPADAPAQRLGGLAVFDGTDVASVGPAGNGLVAESGPEVAAITVYDGDLVIGGAFENASNDPVASYVARWDGTRWQPLGDGLNRRVSAFAQADGRLYAGGGFFDVDQDGNDDDNRLAVWDGTTWQHFGQGFGNGTPEALAVIGDDIYVGGGFFRAADVRYADNIARWDGSRWHALVEPANPQDTDDDVHALAVDTDGTLLVGGAFTGFYFLNHLARWDPVAQDWSRIGPVASSPNDDVNAIAVGPDGIYVGGAFSNLDGRNGGIARWDGTRWQPLGSGLVGEPDFGGDPTQPVVRALYVHEGDVYVGGRFASAGGVEGTRNLARWDGSQWHAISTGLDSGVEALGSFGTTLVAGGFFEETGDNSLVTLGVGFHPLPGTVATEDDALLEVGARLAAWPNPARATARVRLTVPEPQPVQVALYDVLGRRVATLFRGDAGPEAPAETALPDGLAAGLYVVRATGPSFQTTARVSVVR